MLVMQLGPNDGPTSVGPPYLGARPVIVIAPWPSTPRLPSERRLLAPLPKQNGPHEAALFAPSMGAIRLAGDQWLDVLHNLGVARWAITPALV